MGALNPGPRLTAMVLHHWAAAFCFPEPDLAPTAPTAMCTFLQSLWTPHTTIWHAISGVEAKHSHPPQLLFVTDISRSEQQKPLSPNAPKGDVNPLMALVQNRQRGQALPPTSEPPTASGSKTASGHRILDRSLGPRLVQTARVPARGFKAAPGQTNQRDKTYENYLASIFLAQVGRRAAARKRWQSTSPGRVKLSSSLGKALMAREINRPPALLPAACSPADLELKGT